MAKITYSDGIPSKEINPNEANNITVKGDGKHNEIYSGGKADTVNVLLGAKNYQIKTGLGNDKITVSGEVNYIDADAGSDTIIINGGSNNKIIAGKGADKITVDFTKASGNTVIDLGEGKEKDTLTVKGIKALDFDSTVLKDGNLVLTKGEKTLTIQNWNNSAIDGISFTGGKKNKLYFETVENLKTGKAEGTEKADKIIITDKTYKIGKEEYKLQGDSGFSLNSGNGKDNITINSGNAMQIDAGADSDTIIINGGSNNKIIAGKGADKITVDFTKVSGNTIIDLGVGKEKDTLTVKGIKALDFDSTVLKDGNLVLTKGEKTLTIQNWNNSAIDGISFTGGKKDKLYFETVENLKTGNAKGTEKADKIIITDKTYKIGKEEYKLQGDSGFSLNSGNGKDNITINSGNAMQIDAGADNDTIIINGGSNNKIQAGTGADKITVDFTKVSGNTVIDLGAGKEKDTLSVKGVKALDFDSTILKDGTLVLKNGEKTLTVQNWNNSAIDGISFTGGKKDKLYFETVENLKTGKAEGTEKADKIIITDKTYKIGKEEYKLQVDSGFKVKSGNGKDNVTINSGNAMDIDTGVDSDTIIINGGSNNKIQAGTGADKITVDFTKVSGNTVIDLGTGNEKDTLAIKGANIDSFSSVKLEEGKLILSAKDGKIITVANWSNSAIDGITFSGKKKSRQDIEKKAQEGDPKPPTDGVLDNGTWLLGTDKNDTIKASKSRYIAGKDGADTITGSEEKDYIYAGNGNDTITPGKGDDIIHTNSGDDTIIINNGDGADIIIDYGQQNTTIEFKGLTDINSLKFAVTGIVDGFTHRADLTISGYGNSNDSVSIQDFLTHTDADDYDITGYKIKVGSQVYSLLDLVNNNSDINSFSYYLGQITPYQGIVSYETLYGTEINNILYSVKVGEGYHSNLFGEGGDDTLYVGGVVEGASKYVGMTRIYGGKGNDTIYIDGAYNYATGAKVNTNTSGFAYGGSGNDTIYVGNGSYAYGDQYDYMNQKNRTHKVDDGDDTFYVKGISSTVEGGGGNDKIYIQQNDSAYTSYSGSDNTNNVNGGSGYNLIDASGQIAKGILNYTFSKGGNDTLIVGQGKYHIDGKVRGYYKDDNDLVLLASFDNFEAGSLTIKNYYTLTEAQKENIIYAGKPDMLYYTGNKNVIDNPAFNPNNLKLGVLLEYIDLSNSTKSGKFQFAYNHDSGLRDETGITTAVYKMHQVVNSRDEVVTVPREYSHYTLEAAYGGVIYKETTSNIGDNFIIGAADVAQTITGDALNDVIYGAGVGNTANAAGNTIEAGDGHDTVYGGAGADKINGGSGYDWIYGGAGNDILIGGGTDVNGFYTGDYIYGEDGNDIIYTVSETKGYVGGVSNSHNYIYGGAGNDTIYANGYKDYVDGGSGNDIITVYGIGEIDGGAGDDNIIINGTAGVDAGSGNDVIDARKSTGSNGLYGGDGADVIYAGNYGDSITGGHGDDIIFGGDGDDYIIGGDDSYSYLDSDIIYAGAGNDSISVSGTSYVDAGSGDDTITVSGYSGNNYATGVTVDGGIGNDKYVIELANTCTTIYASEGKDTLVLEGYADVAKKPSITKVGNDAVISCKGNSLVVLKDYYTQTSKYADWKVLDSDTSPSLIFSLTDFMKYCSGELRSTTTATNGNDFIENNTVATFNALAGDDVVRASNSNKTVYGGAGSDVITGSKNTTLIYGDNGVEETAADGDDVIYINTNEDAQNCTVYAGGGNDIVNFTSNSASCVRSVEIYGGSGDDSITVNGFASDWTSKVYGGDGDDTVYAKECALVDGGEGNNTIKCEGVRYVVCGRGNDTITGYVAGDEYSKAVVDAGDGNNIIEVNRNAIYMAGSGNDTYDVTAEYGKHKSGMIADCGTNDNDEVKFENINHDELRLVVNVQICEAGSDGATEFTYNNETKYYRVGEFACHDDGSVWESDAAYTSYYSGKDIHKHYQMAIVGEWILDKDAFLENNSDYSWYDEIDFYMNVKNSAENGFKNTALVNVEKYDSVERITFADGYYVNKTDIDGMLEKVAIALVDNSCRDVQQAMDYGNSGYSDSYASRVDQLLKAFGSVKVPKL